jgi:KDO2-lipid IV(A) lauroyltransferase
MSKHSKARTFLEYAAARAVLGGLGLLPRSLAVTAGRAMGRLAYAFGGRLRRTGERNLELAFPALGPRERARILRGSFTSLGRLLGEFSQLSRITPEQLRDIVEVEGLEHYRAASAAGRGVIFFTGHLGAWELSCFAMSALGYPMSFLARRIDNERVDQMVEKIRTRFGNRLINKRAAARPILQTLRAGGTVGLLVDLNTQPHEGVFVDFFGRPASTTAGLARLARHSGAPVLPGFIPWEADRRRFVLHLHPPLAASWTDDESDDIRRFTARFTAVVEDYVRRYPDQWLWIHKRWHTRPPGEPDIYR